MSTLMRISQDFRAWWKKVCTENFGKDFSAVKINVKYDFIDKKVTRYWEE